MLARVKTDTKIIPGHGPLSNPGELRQYRAMLATVRDRVKAAIAQGQSIETLLAAKPLADLDPEWGDGSLQTERFLRIAYRDLTGAP